MNSKLKTAIRSAASSAVETDDGGRVTGVFRFSADFPGFSGHFPGYPVLPAVVQVLSAQVVVEVLLKRPLVMQRLERAKFLQQVRPGQTLRVCCREKKRGVWDARLEADGKPASAFCMTLVEESNG